VDIMDPLARAPDWLLRPLPANAAVDPALHARIDSLAARLPDAIDQLHEQLDGVRMFREYDAAVNRASSLLWQNLEGCLNSQDLAPRLALLRFAQEHLTEAAFARVLRRMVKDPAPTVRRHAHRVLRKANIREVALPSKKNGPWDPTGWAAGTDRGGLARHQTGRRTRQQANVPQIATIGELRQVLEIRSSKQLGYFLLASDAENGPYTRFVIPKRDGSERAICAPRTQLRWCQRKILEQILSAVPAHDAAHGFIPGRSTVTNATPHLHSKVLVKFDLRDFFPTIRYYRVVGLFARLGYPVEDARFSTDDESHRVAATLARLCCYTPDPHAWHLGHCPQGAPTSPAISNLVCRRLDARLAGLAKRNNGVYTRYADDLTFSFAQTIPDLGRLRWWVDQVCHQEGFVVHQDKFRVIRSSQRQVVTGIVVNDVLRVPRPERRRFRAILHNCVTQGIESQARGRKDFAGWLRGYASYIHMVHPKEGAELLRQVAGLVGPEPEEPTP
jgi:retron-type reverse transcriptase